MEHALTLVRQLMEQLGIDADHVVRHYDVTGKLCPGVIGWNADSGSEAAWERFRRQLTQTEHTEEEINMTKEEVRLLVRQEIAEDRKNQAARTPEAQWQLDQLQRVMSLGITDGSRPLDNCSRLEAAIMAANALKAAKTAYLN